MLRCPRAERREARGGPPGLTARNRSRALARGRVRSAEGGSHPPRRCRDRHGGRHRLHGRSRRQSERRPHVALPRALRGGDRARRGTRGAPRRGARGAHREQCRRAPASASRRGLDSRAVADPPQDAGDRARDAGDGDALRHRRRVRVGNAPSGWRRGNRDQRVPVRAGPRPQPRVGAAPRGRLRHRATSRGSSSSSRSRRTTSAAVRPCSSERSRISTRRSSWTSPRGR